MPKVAKIQHCFVNNGIEFGYPQNLWKTLSLNRNNKS